MNYLFKRFFVFQCWWRTCFRVFTPRYVGCVAEVSKKQEPSIFSVGEK